ncbi:hypothetical protein B0H14DRAFT_807982 [Mycena olivaceomarginata]|nr:hypothetical protein B0H14DRAFT_807982 [Mycena olivaceomarginata]
MRVGMVTTATSLARTVIRCLARRLQRLAHRRVKFLSYSRSPQLPFDNALGVCGQYGEQHVERGGGDRGGCGGAHYAAPWCPSGGPQLRQLAGKDRDRDAYGELKGDDGFVDVGGKVTSRTPRRTPAASTSNEKEPWIEAEGEGEGQEHVQGGGPGAQRALSVSRDGRGCWGREWERERERVEMVSPRAAGANVGG